MSLKKSFSVLVFLFCAPVFSLERIENFDLNRQKVKPIYMAFTKVTVIRFENPVTKIRIGAPNFYSYEVDETDPREIAVIRNQNTTVPSNIIIRTTLGEMFVFDLVPSHTNHQDVLYVDSSFYREKAKPLKVSKTRKRLDLAPFKKRTKISFKPKKRSKRVKLVSKARKRVF